MPSITSVAVAAVAATACMDAVSSHGVLVNPLAVIKAGTISSQATYDYVGELAGNVVFPRTAGQARWGGEPGQNQREFATAFKAAGFTSLRELLQKHDRDTRPRFRGRTDNVCGYTDPNAAPVALPADGTIQWGHRVFQWGFQPGHTGPCEAWCDDNLVLHDADCVTTFGAGYPSSMKLDMSKCAGAKRLQFIWLAVHFADWQYWLNCLPLAGSNGNNVVANNTVPSSSVSPVPVPAVVPAPGTPSASNSVTVAPAPGPVPAPGSAPAPAPGPVPAPAPAPGPGQQPGSPSRGPGGGAGIAKNVFSQARDYANLGVNTISGAAIKAWSTVDNMAQTATGGLWS